MGIKLSIDVELNQRLNILDLIQLLPRYEWSILYNDEVSYLPLKDDDMYDWQSKPKECLEDIYEVLNQKNLENEIIGIDLIDKQSHSGGNFLVWPDYKRISLILNIESAKAKSLGAAYFQNRLKPIFEGMGLIVINITSEMV